jgi:hypothetical protein
MKAQKGIWTVQQGKGDRVYIECNDESKIMHPSDICGINGMGMYGYEHLKDLAIAILRYDKEKLESESIISQV